MRVIDKEKVVEKDGKFWFEGIEVFKFVGKREMGYAWTEEDAFIIELMADIGALS